MVQPAWLALAIIGAIAVLAFVIGVGFFTDGTHTWF